MKVTGSVAVHMATVSKSSQEASATKACSAWDAPGDKAPKFPKAAGSRATGIDRNSLQVRHQKKN